MKRMSERKLWTPERDEELIRLWNERPILRVSEICARMGIGDSSLKNRASILRMQGRHVEKRQNRSEQDDFWTAEKDDQLRALWRILPALQVSEIGARMGISFGSVRARVARLRAAGEHFARRETGAPPALIDLPAPQPVTVARLEAGPDGRGVLVLTRHASTADWRARRVASVERVPAMTTRPKHWETFRASLPSGAESPWLSVDPSDSDSQPMDWRAAAPALAGAGSPAAMCEAAA